jgi:hypothetical protein
MVVGVQVSLPPCLSALYRLRLSSTRPLWSTAFLLKTYSKVNIAVGKNKKQGVHKYPNLLTAFYSQTEKKGHYTPKLLFLQITFSSRQASLVTDVFQFIIKPID